MPHAVITFGLMMFCELIYHFIKTQLSFAYQQWLWVIVSRMLLEIFTDSLCSKPPPRILDILWCNAVFLKTWISIVFSTVSLKKIENHKFSFFSSFLVPKMSQFFENGSNTPVGSLSLRSGILLPMSEEYYNLSNLLFCANINCIDMKYMKGSRYSSNWI